MRISDWSSDVCSSDLLLFELLLDREDRLARREAGAVADAEDMGVDREGLRPEGRVHHDIRGLAPDAGQFDERVTVGGDLSAMIADQNFREGDDILCIDRKSTRLNSSP